ncbi:MAG: glycine cleavage system protein GcvH [Chloroflexi bacterium]|nr:glycine cleavage system protein GcvH [Chloroflexota bacterium]
MTPEDRKYSKDHEWALLDDNIATVGITQFAVESLSDVIYVDLPEAGSDVVQFEKFGEIESVKTVSDLISPVSGRILERNQAALDDPELVNRSPYADGWLLKVEIADQAQIDDLLEPLEYETFIAANS